MADHKSSRYARPHHTSPLWTGPWLRQLQCSRSRTFQLICYEWPVCLCNFFPSHNQGSFGRASASSYKRKRETGILGVINGYIGTVEAQGQGTLHLHMLLWLKGSLSTNVMKERLTDEAFCARIQAFISANICADLGDPTGTAVLAIPHLKKVAFSHPIDPHLPNYKEIHHKN